MTFDYLNRLSEESLKYVILNTVNLSEHIKILQISRYEMLVEVMLPKRSGSSSFCRWQTFSATH